MEEKRLDRWLLRTTRRVDGGGMTLCSTVSFRGSGDDIISALGVFISAKECQRTAKESLSTPKLLRFGIDEGWFR